MNTKIACDTCGKMMSPEEAHRDLISEGNYCRPHYIENRLVRVRRERSELNYWLNTSLLPSLRRMDEEIARLESERAG